MQVRVNDNETVEVRPESEWVILRYIYEQMERSIGIQTGGHYLERLCGMDRETAEKVCEAWKWDAVDTPKILTITERGQEWATE